ncbi:MAG TPA: hypothetical protein VGF08_12265 [Terriglobales bacterium]|jgi:hypothetical protein
MSEEIARELVGIEIALLRLRPYAELVAKLGVSHAKEVLGRDGNRYRVASVIMWDSERDGDIRVTIGASGLGVSSLRPTTANFVMTQDGTVR